MVAPTGLLIGTAAGYLGGWVDTVLMRVTDVFLAFPRLILALAFVSALGPGIENAIIAIACTAWPPYARVARAETLTIRRSDFISAIRLQGAGPLRIVLGHVVPALHLVADRPRRPRHGGHHPDRRRPRLPRAGRSAARSRVGRDDRVGPAVPARPVVGGHGPRHRHPGREPRLQPPRGRPPRRPRSRRWTEPREPIPSPPGGDRFADPHRRGPPGPLPGRRRRGRGRPGRELRGRPREARDRGGIGLREVDDRPRHPPPGAGPRGA